MGAGVLVFFNIVGREQIVYFFCFNKTCNLLSKWMINKINIVFFIVYSKLINETFNILFKINYTHQNVVNFSKYDAVSTANKWPAAKTLKNGQPMESNGVRFS
jgi:hypothetical protein